MISISTTLTRSAQPNSTQQSSIERAQQPQCTGGSATTSVQQHCRCRCFQVPSGTQTAILMRISRCIQWHAVPWCNVCRQPACRQSRHFAHTPLHVSHANQRSNNKHNGEDHPPAAAVNTLALLELLLTQPKVNTETASETSLLVDNTSATPDTSPTDAHSSTPGISRQLPTPSDIWTETWQPLELSQPVHAKQGQAAAALQLQMPVALPSLQLWRLQQQQQQPPKQQQQQQQPGQSSQTIKDESVPQPKGLAAATMMRNAQMQLQGIAPAARLQLMALSMASLEDLTESLKGVGERYAGHGPD